LLQIFYCTNTILLLLIGGACPGTLDFGVGILPGGGLCGKKMATETPLAFPEAGEGSQEARQGRLQQQREPGASPGFRSDRKNLSLWIIQDTHEE